MKQVSVTDFKAHLSRYLREIKHGEHLQVTERGVPVACVSPLPGMRDEDDEPDQLRQRLIHSGVLRPGRGRADSILDAPPPEISCSLTTAILDEREDRL